MYEIFYFHWHLFTINVTGKKVTETLIEHKLMLDCNKFELLSTSGIMNLSEHSRNGETTHKSI